MVGAFWTIFELVKTMLVDGIGFVELITRQTRVWYRSFFETLPRLVFQHLELGYLLFGRLDSIIRGLMCWIEDENLLPDIDALGKFFGAISN